MTARPDTSAVRSPKYAALLATQTPKVLEADLLGSWVRGDGTTELRVWRDTASTVRLGVWVQTSTHGWLLTRRAIRLRRREVAGLAELLRSAGRAQA